MKRNEISCGSSEKGRGVRQATSSGALRKAAPMPKASLLPKAVLLPEAASTLNKISCGSSEKGSGARQAASSVVVAAMMATVVAMPPVLRATMAFRPLYYRINFLGGLPLRVTLEIDLALLDKLQRGRCIEVALQARIIVLDLPAHAEGYDDKEEEKLLQEELVVDQVLAGAAGLLACSTL